MSNLSWDFRIEEKGGQAARESASDGTVKVTNKESDQVLKIRLVGLHNGVDEIATQIMEKIADVESCSMTFSGPEAQLKSAVMTIAELIADHTGQQKLDLHFGAKIKQKAT